MSVDHELSHEQALHTSWNHAHEPALTVQPGERIRFDCLNDSGPLITPETRSSDLTETEFIGHHLTGPVEIEGASPGVVVRIDLLDIEHDDWGYTLIRGGDRGVGLLPEAFPDPVLYHWELEDGVAEFEAGIEVPISPFPGVVGLAPEEPGDHDTGPPRSVGGNMDIKHLTAGSTVYLPVEVAGGLLSVGDGHAAQGDGEVCISAIETPTSITARIDLEPDRSIPSPQFVTPGPFAPGGHSAGDRAFATTGIADDLMVASKRATRGMIDHLVDRYELSEEHAYILCSVAGDLKINEIVDHPNWVVSMYLSEGLFPADG